MKQIKPSSDMETTSGIPGCAPSRQMSLFQSVADSFAQHEKLDTATLYQDVARRAGLDPQDVDRCEPIGQSGQRHSLIKRRVRWHQQTLKRMGLLERVHRGVWQLTAEGHKRLALRRVAPRYVMLAFSTDLGVALWADCQTAFSRLDQPVSLVITSPPYPLRKPRAYGNPTESEYVDFLCRSLEPVILKLKPGGSMVLNLSNDIFLPGSPARSLYRERLTLALADRFGLYKMDEIPWSNPSKPPGPVQWASKRRVQLNVGWEPILWMTNDPNRVTADNRRVLQPHSDRHRRLMARGGEHNGRHSADGAYRVRPGRSYANPTIGRIPKNVLTLGHVCGSQNAYKASARALRLPVHGAPFPLALASFFIRFLTAEEDVVADPFAGSLTVGLAAELLGRAWIATDVIWEYLRGGATRFESLPGFALFPGFSAIA